MAEYDELIADLREFGREIILRLERFERSIHELVLDMREERRRLLEEIRASREESRAHYEEQLAESRAQRRALLHILDRLDNGGAAPAT